MSVKMQDQLSVAKRICDTILECVEVAGEQGVPSGHLYAAMMGMVSLQNYQFCISVLKDTGRITESGFLLKIKK